MALRAFVGIELPQAVRQRVLAAGSAYVDADPAWSGEKWVGGDNLHITLRFIGSLDQSDVPDVVAAVERASASSKPFTLWLSDVKAVPSLSRARMLWAAGAGDVEPCARLASRVDEALEPWLAEEDRHPFKPHVTMVRARRPRAVQTPAIDAATAALTLEDHTSEGPVSVRSTTLFSSTFGAGGPTYEILARVPTSSD